MGVKIIKNAIPRSLCLAAEAAFPDQFWPFWHRYNGATSNKFGSMDRARIPAACLAALDALALAVIPYIGESFVDYDAHAAGLHMMPPGGFLGRHLDAETHPIHFWRRTHSIVMNINRRWNASSDGGQLRLESNLDSEPDVLIAPEFGTAVVFTTDNQWHEVLPVAPDANYRKTLALFAWSHDGEIGKTAATFERAT